ncbi:leucine-rich repeat-containing protein 49 isoform X2 [Brienomyrus brachyistius]|uniref:leucine-rich repeat-containing protein 49 isoform X2 n=1 Tax=Brienomyrus brachyistius TaxID=42636 RepID=UPI0020B1DA8A|nr:leucine-rich repeat-containing protein 49 isoform X2 [Brienomyrus brachyistius]
MRPYKRQSSHTARILNQATNSYKLQLAALNSLLPERHVQRQLDSRFPKDASRDLSIDSLKVTNLRQESRRPAPCDRRGTRAPALAFESVGLERAFLPPPAVTPRSYPRLTADAVPPAYRARPAHGAHGVGSVYAPSNTLPTGDVAPFLETSVPSFPKSLCSQDDCAHYPERLDLDRRGLEKCPLVEGGERLRLLNLQHNLIYQIRNLSHLRCLMILDMYDNRVAEMSGISGLTSLRVLLLGSNRIKRICSLDNLMNLDVLDLHGNQITLIENVSHLSELRVLNLAGNYISRVDNLQGLDALTELNLRRNCISSVTELDRLPSLQRLFLSCNRIASFDDLACLSRSSTLAELALDGNPVTQETCYKQTALRCLLHLRQLDMKRVTDEDRRLACFLARKDEERKRESLRLAVQKEKRRLAVQNAAQYWEDLKAGTREVCPEKASSAQGDDLCHLQELRSLETSGGTTQSLSLSDRHLAELSGDTLRLFGLGALEALDRSWGAQSPETITTIAFRYIPFNAIVPMLPRVRVKFPNLSHLIFLETDISRFPQLAALAKLRSLNQLTIHPEGNPVLGLMLWRSFLIYRLHHLNLQKVNSREVTMEDKVSAERLFGTLGHVAATETPRFCLLLLLEQPRKHQLQLLLEGRSQRAGLRPEELCETSKLLGDSLGKTLLSYPCQYSPVEGTEEGAVESGEKTVIARQYLRELVHRVSETSLKGHSLQRLWPSLLREMVQDCVIKMKDLPAYQQACLSRLSHGQ